MQIYGLKNCDTCRAAAKELRAAGHEVTFVDVRETPLDPGLRAAFLEAFGEALVNRRSTTWRGLSEADRAAGPEALLAAHPALMKRPVIMRDGVPHLGWSAATKAALL